MSLKTKAKKKALNVVLVILLFLVIVFGGIFFTCYNGRNFDYGQRKKAIILIPGLYGSALMKEDSNLSYWSLNLDAFFNLFFLGNADKLYQVDDNQQFSIRAVPADMNSAESVRYSLLNVLTPLYKEINERLEESENSEYDLIVWQYDWRQSNETSAEELENFINKWGYEKVILIGHSMGGVVISNYLAKEENRGKTELFVPIASPLLGAGIMMYYQTNESDYAIAEIIGKDLYKKGCNVMPSIHQMLVNNYNGEYSYYTDKDKAFSIDGNAVSAEELISFMADKAIFKNSMGYTWNSITDLTRYQNRLFYTDNGINYQHISHKVNTYYVVGTGINTIVGMNYNSQTENFDNVEKMAVGDNLLTWYSGTAGTPIYSENVFSINGITHYKVPGEKEVVNAVSNKIFNTING